MMRLELLDYCEFLSLLKLIYLLFLSIALSLMLQICIMDKDEFHPSSLEIVMGGLQVFLV